MKYGTRHARTRTKKDDFKVRVKAKRVIASKGDLETEFKRDVGKG
jgi:hypothetical protein